MEAYADFGCVLDVNIHCDACKMRMMEVLRSIAGVYSVTIDGEKGKVMVSGEVNPNILMRALSRPGAGKHAELKYAKVNHPRARRASNYYDDNSYNYGSSYKYYDNNYYNAIEDPYKYTRPMLAGESYHDYAHPMDYYYQTRRQNPEYSHQYYGSNYNQKYSHQYYGSNYNQNSYSLPRAPIPASRSRQFYY